MLFQVKGKPILLLCNKADVDHAQVSKPVHRGAEDTRGNMQLIYSQDEVEVVSRLEIESLVNSAQCPTRVEASVATKDQGLRDGYKWLVKSVITNYLELGDRVATDMAREAKEEGERRKAVKARIEERRRREEEAGEGAVVLEALPGFVPVAELRAGWAAQKDDPAPVQAPADGPRQLRASELVVEQPRMGTKALNGGPGGHHGSNGALPALNGEPGKQNGLLPALNGGPGKHNGLNGGHAGLNSQTEGLCWFTETLRLSTPGSGLELEPVAGPKKRGLLSSLHRTGNVVQLRSVGGAMIMFTNCFCFC